MVRSCTHGTKLARRLDEHAGTYMTTKASITRVYSPLKGLSPRTLSSPFKGLHRGRVGLPPKSRKILIFAVFGRGEARGARKILPRGVGTLSTPGKPNCGNFIFRDF